MSHPYPNPVPFIYIYFYHCLKKIKNEAKLGEASIGNFHTHPIPFNFFQYFSFFLNLKVIKNKYNLFL